ncbi:MAG TPA: PDZ domain-containing protein, partial [Pirellulales bacterium]|nr:PDZ domain-containing protein [Pirellulales bacterium]
MKTAASLALCLGFVAVGATPSSAQTILKQLEAQLRGAAPAAGPRLASADANAPANGFLGMIADDRQENNRGVRVLDVMPGGPAQTSGLMPG